MDGPIDAYKHIVENGGPLALWAGTPSRTVEGTYLFLERKVMNILHLECYSDEC